MAVQLVQEGYNEMKVANSHLEEMNRYLRGEVSEVRILNEGLREDITGMNAKMDVLVTANEGLKSDNTDLRQKLVAFIGDMDCIKSDFSTMQNQCRNVSRDEGRETFMLSWVIVSSILDGIVDKLCTKLL